VTKTHAYVLIDHVEPGKRIRDVLDDLFDQNADTVRFVAQFAGPYIGFVAYETENLGDLHTLANGPFWDAGARCITLVVTEASKKAMPKRHSPDVCAMIRAMSRDPSGTLERLDDTFGPRYDEQEGLADDDRTFGYGAAVVNGDFDLLIEVGAETKGGAIALVNEVKAVPGVGRTSTAFAFLPGNAKKRTL
jgi:hypothetical protein